MAALPVRAIGCRERRFVPVARAEDILVMKVLADRPQDIEDVVAILAAHPVKFVAGEWDNGSDCAARLTRMLVERPPLAIGDEPTIADGVDITLDELRALRDGGKDAIATIQAEERARTGINSPHW